MTAAITAGADDRPATPQAVLDSFRPGLVVVSAIALTGLLITLTGLRRRVSYGFVVASSDTAAAPVGEDRKVPVAD
ncbi:hypothetical protein [Streptomyces sp. NPDC001070]